ncbi:MAG TPA: hypothetical protein VF793_11120, partial [Telluria sp.]
MDKVAQRCRTNEGDISQVEGLERPVRRLTFRYKLLHADDRQAGMNGRILMFKKTHVRKEKNMKTSMRTLVLA